MINFMLDYLTFVLTIIDILLLLLWKDLEYVRKEKPNGA